MKKYIILPIVLLVLFTSCNERNIDLFDDANYIYFEKNIKDTTKFSFFFHINDVVDHPVIVNLGGKVAEENIEYKITIDSKVTKLPSNIYEMPERYIFRKGMSKDTFYIKLTNDLNNDELKAKSYLFAFDIEPVNNTLKPGEIIGRHIMTVSNKAERPAWWTLFEEIPGGPVDISSVESLYLGKYSDLKYECFMEATGISDMTNFPGPVMREYAIIFKHWLAKQEPKIIDEDNNQEMQVPVIGE